MGLAREWKRFDRRRVRSPTTKAASEVLARGSRRDKIEVKEGQEQALRLTVGDEIVGEVVDD